MSFTTNNQLFPSQLQFCWYGNPLANLVEPGDKVVGCQNGVFGGRMKENVERCGGHAILVESPWGRAVDPQKVESALKHNPDSNEGCSCRNINRRTQRCQNTKTGPEHNCLSIVDTVTSLIGSELRVDDWQLDAVYSETKNAFHAYPEYSNYIL